MKRRELEDALVGGVALALKRASDWSCGNIWPGDTGAENLIQVSVAESIYDARGLRPPAIYLEPSFGRLAPHLDRPTRRVDIALLTPSRAASDDVCYCVIEVKKYPSSVSGDIIKIAQLLRALKTMRYGYLVTYFQHRVGPGATTYTPSQKMDMIHERVERVAHAQPLLCERVVAKMFAPQYIEDENSRYLAGAVVHCFRRRGRA